ncbi:DUF5916 domain-containing protein [Luteirhabdus pelagi]|uniref:DUF5916 domain-containing protein n=1 Tax=Luteirhabdus pelagi TaxID=2792783 RepID=UPI001939F5E5|nr:DUF5916 domain-containing protein [Luteirhabdus pelagi]
MFFKNSLYLFFLVGIISFGQSERSLTAIRTENPPVIDGLLNDEVWVGMQGSEGFFMYEPGNEGTISEAYTTKVKLAYDDNAVYVAAYMAHPYPSEIKRQFSQRDDVFVQADHFAVALNTYNDGINETRFFVTSAGAIGDSKVSLGRQDFSYDVVFDARISFDDKGWYAEYKIPYNALRFPETEVQDWSVNFYRRLINENETHTWSFIDRSQARETQYNGEVLGVKGINPPIRLSFFPFGQATVSNFDGETDAEISAGMDLKYGLSDSFTLDATLVPDFGQAAFDNVRLNLGPFEQTFGENRQFFIEGTELFDRGGLFFSRRIGNGPSYTPSDKLRDNEIISNTPEKVNLLNALKISGRTKNELGLGFLNAITEQTYVTIRDTLTGERRKVLAEPVANYNIVVMDQQFNKNSSISLVNTNVIRDGGFRDANASAFVFNVTDTENRYNVSGRALMSYVNPKAENSYLGFRSEFDLSRIKGNFRWRIGHDFANTTFDINDLGLVFRNNFNDFVAGISYETFEPTKRFNKMRFTLTGRHQRLYKPNVKTANILETSVFFVKPSRFAFGGNMNYVSDNDDYFEPRIPGRFVTFNQNLGGRVWVSSDYRRKFAYDAGIGYRSYFEDPQRDVFFDISPRFRFSNNLLVIWRSDFSFRNKNFGYIDDDGENVFLGQRNVSEIENSVTASYNFDAFKALDLRFRNFWSAADYREETFFILKEDGTRDLFAYDTSENDPNRNFNIWNLDISFRWRFAPGSEATLLYRNQLFNQDNASELAYSESLEQLFKQPMQNTLSLRITYFLDVSTVRSIFQTTS